MFGTNPTEHVVRDDGQVLDVQEVFPTIQGEGPLAGSPAVFVRLAGCHLKCYYCDTDFLSKRKQTTLSELLAQIDEVGHFEKWPNNGTPMPPWYGGPKVVVLTGGEPMRQNIVPLCMALAQVDHHVQIETAGSFWPHGVYGAQFEGLIFNNDLSVVCSPKLASVHEKIAHYATFKYVVGHDDEIEADGLPASSTQLVGQRVVLARPARSNIQLVYLQPRDSGDIIEKRLARNRCIDLCIKHGYRLSLQQHKIIGVP